MKKSDLKYGNVVELRNGDKLLLCRSFSLSEYKLIDLSGNGHTVYCTYYCEDLTNIDGLENLDIIKVYKDYTCKELLWERKEKLTELTEDEKFILRNLPKKYKWIVRDHVGSLWIFENKPINNNMFGGWFYSNASNLPFPNLFKFIKYEDEEPYSIEDLLKGEEK